MPWSSLQRRTGCVLRGRYVLTVLDCREVDQRIAVDRVTDGATRPVSHGELDNSRMPGGELPPAPAGVVVCGAFQPPGAAHHTASKPAIRPTGWLSPPHSLAEKEGVARPVADAGERLLRPIPKDSSVGVAAGNSSNPHVTAGPEIVGPPQLVAAIIVETGCHQCHIGRDVMKVEQDDGFFDLSGVIGGTEEHWGLLLRGLKSLWAKPKRIADAIVLVKRDAAKGTCVGIALFLKARLLDKRQEEGKHTGPLAGIWRYGGLRFGTQITGGKPAVGVMKIVAGQGELLEVVEAFAPSGGFAGHLHRRKEQRNEQPDDGDHHQQLNERKSLT